MDTSAKCVGCPLAGSKDVGYSGKKESRIIIIGESPGQDELVDGLPFIGKSGKLLRRVCNEANIDIQNEVFIMNSARCLVDKKIHPQKSINQILAKCRRFVEPMIHRIKPSVIICAGAFALQQIMRKKGIKQNRGTWMHSTEFNCDVMPTYHPSYCLRFPAMEKFLLIDLQSVRAFMDNDCKPATSKKGVLHYRDIEDLSVVFQEYKGCVSIDTEGQGLDWVDPTYPIISFSVSTAKGRAYHIWMYEECSLDDPELDFRHKTKRKVKRSWQDIEVGIKKCSNFEKKMSDLRELLTNPKYKKIMQNGKFDIHVFENLFNRYGDQIKVEGFLVDTQAAAQLLDENLYRLANLETLQACFTDFKPQYSQMFSKLGNKSDMLSIDKKELRAYSLCDADVTRRAGINMVKQLSKNPRLQNYFTKFVMPTINLTIRTMENNGSLVDQDQLPKTKAIVKRDLDKKYAEVMRVVPQKIIDLHLDENKKEKNLSLTRLDLVKDIVFHEDGFNCEVVKKTASGPSIDKKVRAELLRKKQMDPLAKKFLRGYGEWRELHDFHSKNLEGFRKSIRSDGRIHSTFSNAVAVTGRLSSKDPNLMNVPNRSPLAPRVRELIFAPDGWKLLAADSGQCLVPETPIITIDGILPLSEVIVKKIPVLSMNTNYQLSFEDVNHGWCTGRQEVYRIGLDDGSYVDCTLKHKFKMYSDEFKELKDIKVGDRLVHVYENNAASYPDHKVVSIKKLGVRTTYQIEVNNNHNYILANGLCSKNSELRWIAAIAGERNMMRVFQQGKDIHTATAMMLTGKTEEQLKASGELKTARTNAKAVNFGLVFGMGIGGFIRYALDEYKLKLSWRQADQWIKSFFRMYPGLLKYHRNAVSFCMRNGFVESPFGRRRRLLEINSEDEYFRAEAERQAINHPVQSASSDSTLVSANEMVAQDMLDPERIRLTLFIHDELVFEVKEEKDGSNIMDCAKMIKHMMENPPLKKLFNYDMPVPLMSEVAVGKNLAQMKELDL